ncbi:NAD-dependent deacetylase sirtuin-2 [Saitoella complicata NRRL Y-17804]|uniref:NAD-dependent protein deacetylase n=1 Tax=Saitoella complicata (strain BCRC 22490 / CBS 7301 / JCM 7358 / NBRC 10748 / NRRL Y-17804) TaxID=698492 RepID=A0A0E9NTK8_SAICN|nr:NAD-dependent deacetylase sirtuin-2 [Saitoella complicata NRRL Y-17804]ODQ55189.1 NAD-dependent deacetylase sirtuin-2 [Saitoella complicata NRRL Y-17804]GAO52740.1 hypothetical protein G7K_6810-t1 [Saitoella complicata NRRL Y-17804]
MAEDRSRPIVGTDLKVVADYIKTGKAKAIHLFTGAGISTSSGIPDFRSPTTGLYANLARLNLPYAEAVFDIDFFRHNPYPFYELARELWPGRYKPTTTHAFIRLLQEKKLLGRCWSQNIDTLERRAGVSGERLVEAHGSFAGARCINPRCATTMSQEEVRKHVFAVPSTVPTCHKCASYVKPNITFFGENLPGAFFASLPSLGEADLAIVIGTSLTVYPFAGLVKKVRCPRVLINMQCVGDFDEEEDVVWEGACDQGVEELCAELGWTKELHEIYDTFTLDEEVADMEQKDAKDEVEEMTEAVEKGLKIDGEENGGRRDGKEEDVPAWMIWRKPKM